MNFTAFSFILVSLTAIIIYFQVKKSYRQGLSKTLIRLSVIIFCAFSAAYVSMFVASLAEESIMDMIRETDLYISAEESIGSGVSVLNILFEMIFPILIYLPVFLILRIVCSLLSTAIYKIAVREPIRNKQTYHSESEDRYVRQNRLISATLGVFIGFVLSAIIFMPFVGAIKTAKHVVITIDHLAPDSSIKDNELIEELDYYADDVTVTVFYVCADKLLFDISSTAKYGDDYTNLGKEVSIIENFEISDLQSLLSSINGMSSNLAARLTSLLDEAEESAILTELLLSFTKDSTEAWIRNESYMGMQRPVFDQHAAFDVFMDEFFYVLSLSTRDTIYDDIETIINVGTILNDSKRLFTSGNYNAMVTGMSRYGVVNQIKAELEKNPNMQRVANAVDGIVMSIVADEMRNSEVYTDEQCEQLFDELADIMTSTMHLKGSSRMTEIMKAAEESFENCGIKVPEDMRNSIVSILVSEFDSESGTVDQESVRDFFGYYTDAIDKFK